MFAVTSSFVKLLYYLKKQKQKIIDEKQKQIQLLSFNSEENKSFPVVRRDNVDIECIRSIIENEISRVKASGESLTDSQAEYLDAFARGVWAGAKGITDIMIFEIKPYNERKFVDPDHWYELNTVSNY
jgi:hypothetical protein